MFLFHKFLGFEMPVNQTQGPPLVHTCWSLICLFQLDKPAGPQKTRLCEADLIGFGGSVVSNTIRRMEKKNTAGVLFLLSWCWGSCWNLLIIAWGLSQINGTASYTFPKCPASSACGSSSITEIKPRNGVPTNNDIICITTYTYILYVISILYIHQKNILIPIKFGSNPAILPLVRGLYRHRQLCGWIGHPSPGETLKLATCCERYINIREAWRTISTLRKEHQYPTNIWIYNI